MEEARPAKGMACKGMEGNGVEEARPAKGHSNVHFPPLQGGKGMVQGRRARRRRDRLVSAAGASNRL